MSHLSTRWKASLDRNPLHQVPRHLLLPPIIKPRGPRIRMPQEILYVLHRHALLEEVGRRRNTERMRRERAREPGALETALHHVADILAGHRSRREALFVADGGPEERALFGLLVELGPPWSSFRFRLSDSDRI